MNASGDSGGPVWDRRSQKAVGLIAAGVGKPCPMLGNGARSCPKLAFTPLMKFPQHDKPIGVQSALGIAVIAGG